MSMKEYLFGLLVELQNRCIYLRSLIPHPLKFPELLGLADRCTRIIEETTEYLLFLKEELEKRNEEDISDIFRSYRMHVREMEQIEKYGITALYYQTKENALLNRIIFKIHQEINLPLIPPAIACISTNYFYIHSSINVIFVPIGESNFLLHLPDIYHEIGHSILFNKTKEEKLNPIKQWFIETVSFVTEYYQNLLNQKKRETGPPEIPEIISLIHYKWKYWIEEFFADMFACYTLGPAYVWSHLHLTTKKCDNVYDFNPLSFHDHPSDDSRMKLLCLGLKTLGYEDIGNEILNKWKKIPAVYNHRPVNEYQYAYPREIIDKIASSILLCIKKCNFNIMNANSCFSDEDQSISTILNIAWKKFWKEPNEYRVWEKKTMELIW